MRREWWLMGCWALLWGGLNARPELLFIGDTLLERLHGARAMLPLLGGYLAMLWWLLREPRIWAPWTAMGAFCLYALVGLIVSPVVSPAPWIALYWAGAFASTLAVLALAGESADRLRQILRFNWLALGGICVAMALVALSAPTPEGQVSWYDLPVRVRYIAGMPMVRPTGIARYAAVLGLLAWSRLLFSPRWAGRAGWAALLMLCAGVLAVCQSTGALLGFGVGAGLILVLRRGWWWAVAAGLVTLAAGLALDERLIELLSRGKTLQTLWSGRPDIWSAGVHLFLSSPLLGCGFHADRLLLPWPYKAHISNAWLHAAAQAGVIGFTVFAAAWLLTIQSVRRALAHAAAVDRSRLVEVTGVIMFLAVRTLFESSGAFFGIDWLLLAPVVAYVQRAARPAVSAERIG